MSNPTAAILIIGDEILSGRTRDINMYHIAGTLSSVGIDLMEARVVSDDKSAIINAVRDLSKQYDNVFTSGGIGPTHDDITADCVAEAFGAHLSVRDDARSLLKAHYESQGKELTEERLRMARIPEGAVLIENPISIAPGFSLENVHVMAGVPRIFAVMVDKLLLRIETGNVMSSETIRVDLPESAISSPLRKIAEDNSELSIGSYPFEENGGYGANIVIRGFDLDAIKTAVQSVRQAFDL